MRWQDIVISTAQLGFVYALWPSIRSKDKPAATTSIINVTLITPIAICFFTLHLWYSGGTDVIIDAAWLILAIQKTRLNKISKK